MLGGLFLPGRREYYFHILLIRQSKSIVLVITCSYQVCHTSSVCFPCVNKGLGSSGGSKGQDEEVG